MEINARILLGKRIRYLRKQRGWTQPHLAALCGWTEESSQTRISHYEKGSREPVINDIARIAKAFGLSLADLFDFDKPIEKSNSSIIHLPKPTKKIPHITDWQYIDQFVKLGDLSFPHEETEVDNNISDTSFSIEVHGDSMVAKEGHRDSLYPGDIAIIDYKKSPSPFSIVWVKVENEYWLRQYVPHGNYIELRPLNKDYPPFKLGENAQIVGVIVEWRRK